MKRVDLLISDTALLDDCRVDVFRGSGPGGQKRNKTSNAVRLTHLPTRTIATAVESRSLRENRLYALRRLRIKLAAALREPINPHTFTPPQWFEAYVIDKQLHINPRNPHHPAAAALLLDMLDACHAHPTAAAINLGISPRSFVNLLAADSHLWLAANRLREKYAEPALTKP